MLHLVKDTVSACRTKAGGRVVEVCAILVFLACGGVVAKHTAQSRTVGDAPQYHASIQQAVVQMPKELGKWVGIDMPLPAQAENLLRPTAFLCRRYVNRESGEVCVVSIVDCGDVRDMLDHYPPNCYPGQGWVLNSQVPTDVLSSFGTVYATEYEFSRGRFGASNQASVTNTMLSPNGTTSRDMRGVERLLGNAELRRYGVGQLQVYFEQAISVGRRREIAREMIDAHRSCILAILRSSPASLKS